MWPNYYTISDHSDERIHTCVCMLDSGDWYFIVVTILRGLEKALSVHLFTHSPLVVMYNNQYKRN